MYSIFFCIILITLILYLLYKLYKKNLNVFATFLLTISIFYFVIFPKNCMIAAFNGAKLFVNAIVPSLFPFMVICNLLVYFQGIELYGKILGPLICKPFNLSKNSSFPIVASILCGYPVGAKYCSQLYTLGYIDKAEYERLINIASNAGPLFILGSVGGTMLGDVKLGYIILLSNYISALAIAILTYKKPLTKNSVTFLPTNRSSKNLGDAIRISVNDSVNSVLMVGGYVISFSVLIEIIKNNAFSSIILNNDILTYNKFFNLIPNLVLSSIDLTNGCNIISLSNYPLIVKIPIISFLCGFGSFSVIAQTSAFFQKHNVNLSKYIFRKFMQGFIAMVTSFILCIFTLRNLPAWNNLNITITEFSLLPYIILCIITLIALFSKKLFNIS